MVLSTTLPQTRGYQQEMLEESLQRNIIVALDTGSGKTHIAVLRMKFECERETKKVSWFLAPTVALCEQQRHVIRTSLPVSVGLISGAQEPDQWKNPCLWRTVLDTHRIMVSTPQPLLDALRHGYVDLGKDISLVIFDEAHHAVHNHPYNQIMKEFYFRLPVVNHNFHFEGGYSRPKILGLTASPIFGGDVERAFGTIEGNLDCSIRTPRRHTHELASFVYRPIFKHVLYTAANWFNRPFSANLTSLEEVVDKLNIEDDPYVQSLRQELAKLGPGAEQTRIDQTLSKTISKGKTYTQRGLKEFVTAAGEISMEIGPWAADWYVSQVIEHAKVATSALRPGLNSLKGRERAYLLSALDRVVVNPVSYDPQDIVNGCSDKLRVLVECLEAAKADAEANNDAYSGLVFVTRRDTVLALAKVISLHPRTVHQFNVGHLLGTSESRFRQSFLDITRKQFGSQEQTLMDFKIGEKNLIISTSVAEEGIDIQSCCSVIRWDPAPNMVSLAQSRGRARQQRSTFIAMYSTESGHEEELRKWENLESQMVSSYNDAERERARERERAILEANAIYGDDDDEDEDDKMVLRVESTGASITPHSAISHLSHFCAVIPSSGAVHCPIYDVDPPDFPHGWHSSANHSAAVWPQYSGPFGSTVTLPRCIDSTLRVFSVEKKYKSKIAAHRNAAFKAYCSLHQAGLLNEHLLPGVAELEEEVKDMLKDVEKRSSMASVLKQIDPWAVSEDSNIWWSSKIAIEGLPVLGMFTKAHPITLVNGEGPLLYRPNSEPVRVEWHAEESSPVTGDIIDRARIYTREIFWAIYGSRMRWDDLDFSYLFLPIEDPEKPHWDARRAWLTELNARSGLTKADPFLANAATFGMHLSFPTDLTLIRNQGSNGKGYLFHRWEHNALSSEEEQELWEYYSHYSDLEIKYPLLVVQYLPRRAHLLIPIPSPTQAAIAPKEKILIPRLSTVALFSRNDIEYSTLLPSIIRFLSMAMTVQSFREALFSNSPLNTIPVEILTVALTTPASQESYHYQRLETLGDTVLKFIVGVQLLAEYPFWHEGYLTKKKDHSVSNARLAREALSKELHRWIIRDRLVARKWKPALSSTTVMEQTESETGSEPDQAEASKTAKKKQELSTKVLADVVEALIGAAYLHGNFDMGIECAQLFGLGIRWEKLPQRIDSILSRIIDHFDDFPPQIAIVELMLGHEFQHKLLLVEALSHASHESDMRTVSYERMEFLGDSVLDMVVTDLLYHAPGKKYSPGHMHIRKSAVVNSHFLAFICLQCFVAVGAKMPRPDQEGSIALADETNNVYLWQCLLHSSHFILEAQQHSFTRYQKARGDIESAMRVGTIFPWAALTSLQAPKFLSDMIESVLGAVYLDSRGDFGVVRGVMRKLGILPILERIVADDVDVFHPVSRLSMWASKHDKKVEYEFEKTGGRVACLIMIDDEETIRVEAEHKGHASQEEVKFRAAERAILTFKLRDNNSQSLWRKKKKSPSRKRKNAMVVD